MEIKEITNKQEWEDFLLKCEGKTIWRLGIFDNEELISVALVIKHTAKRGSFLLVPHGPVIIRENLYEVLSVLKDKLKEIAKSQKIDFIRINPVCKRSLENEKIFKDLGFRLRALHTHPESSWKLNIEPTQEEILSGMRKTTRYLVKQAEKNKVEIIQTFNIEDIEIFNKMHLEVVKRQKFIPFSLEYFKK